MMSDKHSSINLMDKCMSNLNLSSKNASDFPFLLINF